MAAGGIQKANGNGASSPRAHGHESFGDGITCKTCYAMTGTPEGIEALLNGGYDHLAPKELAISACPACKSILQAMLDGPGGEWKDYPEPSSLHVVVERWKRPPPLNGLEALTVRIRANGVPPPGPPGDQDLWVRWLREMSDERVWNLPYGKIPVVTYDLGDAADYVPARPACKMLTPTLVSAIRRNIDDCLENHKQCPRRKIPKLPRRVLDLGLGGVSKAPSRLRLYQSKENEEAEYVALSYCWGQNQDLVTKTTNLSSHLDAIPEARLPKTIFDAIAVCRKLEIRYLWVDALCIVQDDNNDKLSEIGKMVDIYRGSLLTIVAANAGKVSDGFLDDHDDETRLMPQLPLYIDKSTTGTIYLRGYKGHNDEETLTQEPLFTRGWTFQEYVLSPRALVFDSRQVLYKCSTFHDELRPVLETGIRVWSPTIQRLPVTVFDISTETQYDPGNPDGLAKDLDDNSVERWREVVEEYSKRNLSFFGDRLSALAGVAEALGKAWNGTYIAGMWAETLAQHLCWLRTGGPIVDPKNGAQHLGTPSWSWASSWYPVHILDINGPDVKLMDHNVDLVSDTLPYGPVKRASIILEARIFNASDVYIRGEGDYSEFILFDDPNMEGCLNWKIYRFLYVGFLPGSRNGRRHQFLVLEEQAAKTFRRVGWLSGEKVEDEEFKWDEVLEKVMDRQIIILV
ncbi:heterokaryon incompatibility protein-domain-containing protein [Cladorrhinum sp. PSN332]|nr:heterokaryon incompatibility protein-domain-containing protein [Cladorrhinum sp. PSN332]